MPISIAVSPTQAAPVANAAAARAAAILGVARHRPAKTEGFSPHAAVLLRSVAPHPLADGNGPCLDLQPGDRIDLEALDPQLGWRVLHGGLRVDARAADGHCPARSLLLPGDLLPLAELPGWMAQNQVRALMATRLVSDAYALAAPAPLQPLANNRLRELLVQQWQRGQDMLRLRGGSVPDRIRHLMLMLATAHDADPAKVGAEQTLRLPRVRDIADLVDSTPESVSRTMTALKRLDLLAERKGTATRFDAERLSTSTLPLGLTRSVPVSRTRRPTAAKASAVVSQLNP